MSMLYRTLDVQCRDKDIKTRSATFVAATEAPVPMWRGAEVLRTAGADLHRYRKNPVVLDTHNRDGISSIVGSADVTSEGSQLVATVRFANNAKGQEAWGLVDEGHLRAVSIGYVVDPESVRELTEGQRDGETEGPAFIVDRWSLYEISMVPVPADEDALKRQFYSHSTPEAEEGRMAAEPAKPTIEPPAAPAPAPEAPPEIPSEVAARKAKAELEEHEHRAALIRAMTPSILDAVADELILEGVTVEEARVRLLAAYRAQSKPGFTPEPAPSAANEKDTAALESRLA